MSTVTLVVIPGPGARTVTINPNMTVAQLACQENLHGRDIIINGAGIPASQWETTVISQNAEIFATGSVKGNQDTITLVVIPGPGARIVDVSQNMTLAQLVCEQNLHGRDIIVNGAGIPAAQWETTLVSPNSEVFATGSVKGNI
jgi:sulfur carrier protein ThiS